MKLVTVHALVVGEGRTVAAGTATTAAELDISLEECRALHARGAIRILAEESPASAPDVAAPRGHKKGRAARGHEDGVTDAD